MPDDEDVIDVTRPFNLFFSVRNSISHALIVSRLCPLRNRKCA